MCILTQSKARCHINTIPFLYKKLEYQMSDFYQKNIGAFFTRLKLLKHEVYG
jgi:hypothetical protein